VWRIEGFGEYTLRYGIVRGISKGARGTSGCGTRVDMVVVQHTDDLLDGPGWGRLSTAKHIEQSPAQSSNHWSF
jgi:hypothetical protein